MGDRLTSVMGSIPQTNLSKYGWDTKLGVLLSWHLVESPKTNKMKTIVYQIMDLINKHFVHVVEECN